MRREARPGVAVQVGGSIPAGCRVELLGMARLLAGTPELSLDLNGPMTVEQLLPAIARQCPALIGPVLGSEGTTLTAGYVVCRNGRDFLTSPVAVVHPGDRLLLLSSPGGG